jgi:hypothetical protein
LENCLEPVGHPSIRLNKVRDPFSEDLASARGSGTDKFTHHQTKDYAATPTGHIGDRPLIGSMDSFRRALTKGAEHNWLAAGEVNTDTGFCWKDGYDSNILWKGKTRGKNLYGNCLHHEHTPCFSIKQTDTIEVSLCQKMFGVKASRHT